MKHLLTIVLLVVCFSFCNGQVQWICVKHFKPYYFPGDYEVYKLKGAVTRADTMPGTIYVHDTIYIDSCRLRTEAFIKDFEQGLNVHKGIDDAPDTAFLNRAQDQWSESRVASGAFDWKDTIPYHKKVVHKKRHIMRVRASGIYKGPYQTTKYRTIYRDHYYHDKAVRKKPVHKVFSPPTEIMIKASYYLNHKLVKTRYKTHFDSYISIFKNPLSVNSDSVHYQIYIP